MKKIILFVILIILTIFLTISLNATAITLKQKTNEYDRLVADNQKLNDEVEKMTEENNNLTKTNTETEQQIQTFKEENTSKLKEYEVWKKMQEELMKALNQ